MFCYFGKFYTHNFYNYFLLSIRANWAVFQQTFLKGCDNVKKGEFSYTIVL